MPSTRAGLSWKRRVGDNPGLPSSSGRRRSATTGAVLFRNQSLPRALPALLSIPPAFSLATRTILKRVADGGFINSTATLTTKLLGALSVDL